MAKGGDVSLHTPLNPAARSAIAEPAAPDAVASALACARRRPGTGPARISAVRQGSTVALARQGDAHLAYIADEDDSAIHTVDIGDHRELAVTPLTGAPSQLLVLADGRVAVTLRDQNRVAIFEPRDRADLPLEERCSTPIAAEPVALAATPDDARLVVTSGLGRALTALDPADLRALFTVELPRDPRAVLVDADGKRAFVAHMVGGWLSTVSLVDDAPHLVHPVELRVGERPGSTSKKPLPREGVQGFALASAVVAGSKDAARIFAPRVSVDPGGMQATSGYGNGDEWGPAAEEPLVSVVDAAAERLFLSVPGADRLRRKKECLLPRAAVVRGDALLVACLGIDALLDLDARSIDPIRVERRRFRVPAGPTGIAVDDKGRAVVWSQFAHEVAVVDLSPSSQPTMRIPVARREGSWVTAEVARGRELFHTTQDLRISRDGRACASCHPDGRDDALTWSTPTGPRQTIMLAGRLAGSAPYGWFGKSPTLKVHIGHSFQRLGGRGLLEAKDRADFDALIAYLVAMRAPTRAGAPEDPARAELARHGKALFMSPQQGCATCHADGGTDHAAYDVKSGHIDEASLKFDTPSLRFVGSTAPYFHDGRYATLDELILASDGKMGHTANLSRDDRRALSAYLESLSNAPQASAPPSAGWIRPAVAALPMPPVARPAAKSLEALLERSGAARIPMAPITLRLADLPRIEVEPAPDFKNAVKTTADLEEAKEILAFGREASVRDRPLGFIEVASNRAPFYAFGGGGVSVSCRGDVSGKSGAEWQGLKAQPDGTLKFERALAWFDHGTCKAYSIERNEVTARDIGGGIAFAFRTACPKCKLPGETLHVLAPRVDWDSGAVGDTVAVRGIDMPFTHAELPLRQGAAGAIVSRFTPDGITEWKKSGVKTTHEKHTLLGVQVAQGAGEAEPVAIVYVVDLPPP